MSCLMWHYVMLFGRWSWCKTRSSNRLAGISKPNVTASNLEHKSKHIQKVLICATKLNVIKLQPCLYMFTCLLCHMEKDWAYSVVPGVRKGLNLELSGLVFILHLFTCVHSWDRLRLFTSTLRPTYQLLFHLLLLSYSAQSSKHHPHIHAVPS